MNKRQKKKYVRIANPSRADTLPENHPEAVRAAAWRWAHILAGPDGRNPAMRLRYAQRTPLPPWRKPYYRGWKRELT